MLWLLPPATLTTCFAHVGPCPPRFCMALPQPAQFTAHSIMHLCTGPPLCPPLCTSAHSHPWSRTTSSSSHRCAVVHCIMHLFPSTSIVQLRTTLSRLTRMSHAVPYCPAHSLNAPQSPRTGTYRLHPFVVLGHLLVCLTMPI